MNDLEWLARNVHEWPNNEDGIPSEFIYTSAFLVNGCGIGQPGDIFDERCATRDQWLAERARLQKLEPRPEEQTMTKKEWRGPEDGLPPVGTECEVFHNDEWVKCEIIGHFKQPAGMCVAFVYGYDERFGIRDIDYYMPDAFRPLRTEEDRAVEDMINIIAEAFSKSGGEWAENEDIARAIYAAGYRKQEPSE